MITNTYSSNKDTHPYHNNKKRQFFCLICKKNNEIDRDTENTKSIKKSYNSVASYAQHISRHREPWEQEIVQSIMEELRDISENRGDCK